MPITVQYQPSSLLVGQAAYDTGRAEALRQQQEEAARRQAQQQELAMRWAGQQQDAGFRTAQLGEQGRQFDATNALRQQQFEAETAQDAFNRQIAQHRDRLAQYGILQQAANQQNQLAEVDLRGQYGLAEHAMDWQGRLAAEQLQQQGQGQRAGQEMQGRFGMQWQAQAAKQMQADWQNIQKVLPRLDPGEREDLIGQFRQRWETANVPMPVELPQEQLPEYMDPNVQWDKANQWAAKQAEMGNHVLLVPDEKTGMPSIPRGWPQFPQTPEGMQQKNAAELEKEKIKSQDKAQAAQIKVQESYDKQDLTRMDAEMKAAQAEDKHIQDQRHAEDLHFGTMQKNLADLQLKIANAKAKPADMAVNTAEMEKTVADYKAQIEKYKAKRQAETASDQFGGGSPSRGQPTPVSSPAEAATLPKGTPVILPDGRVGVVK